VLVARATRGYAEALEAGNFPEAKAWARIGLSFLVTERTNGATAAGLDILEGEYRAEHGVDRARSSVDDLPAPDVAPCSECGLALSRSRIAEFPGSLTCSPACGRARRGKRLAKHHAQMRESR